ncbi:MAG: alcohol dehydrogenase catalytic domain-containing protein [Verrucomicrobiae bacterium]|nr:alcohol dehydrogenase catalytic domain-containing protein [Verrucomicrobiae bacterium]
MLAARLYGPRDLRIEQVPDPLPPRRGQVLLRVTATGICGSDLHTYKEGRIGDTTLRSPLVPGHEFSGVVERAGAGVRLRPGTRVAVDPAMPCRRCDRCREGNSNLCPKVRFCGLWPDDGSLREFMLMPAANCFPLPPGLTDEDGVMLEPLGIAIHATGLGKIRKGDTVAVLGCGCIGLCLIQTVRLAGAVRVFVSDPLAWRQELGQKLGGKPLSQLRGEVDVVLEAAWAGAAAQQAVEICRPGGRVVLVGVPDDNRFEISHAIARRKGLTLLFSRRMRHTYPQAVRMVRTGRVDVRSMITHRFPLKEADRAFRINAEYQDNVIKVIITC